MLVKNLVIDLEKVQSVYNGKSGCMCGCNGKHRYATKHREVAGKGRGYEISDDEVSDRSVKMLVNKFNKIGEFSIDTNVDGSFCDHIFIEMDGRMKCMYLLKNSVNELMKNYKN